MDVRSWRNVSWDAATREPLEMRCRAFPDESVVREPMHLRLEFAPVGFDLPAGSEIGIEVPRIWRKHLGMAFRGLHDEFATEDDRHPGGSFCLVTAHASEDGDAVLSREIVSIGFEFLILVTVAEGVVREGEVMSVYLADPIGPRCEAPKAAQSHPFRTLVRPDAQEHFQEVAAPPVVIARGGPAAKLRLRCPAVVATGGSYQARLCAVDGVGENSATDYRGRPHVWRPGTGVDARALVLRTGEQRSWCVSLTRGDDNFEYQTAHDEFAGIAGVSNPVGRPEDFGCWRVHFGDIHCHSKPCDAFGTMREAYEYGYLVSGLDFCTVSHQQLSPGHRFTQADRDEYLAINDTYDAMEDFATVIGAEVYCTDGHRIVYFPSTDEARRLPVARDWWGGEGFPTVADLSAQLDGLEAITVMHHPRFIWPLDWSRSLHEHERCVEICSRWGSSEEGGPHSVQAALAYGHRLGFVGGTDNHLGQPGNGCFGVSDGIGITGALTHDLSREALYEAMAARRCYATSGERMLIYFALDGRPMGSELSGWQGRRSFDVSVAGTEELTSVELLRNNEVVASVKPAAKTFVGELCDSEPMDGLMLAPHFDDVAFCFYYLRAKQADGAMAWASPIWLT